MANIKKIGFYQKIQKVFKTLYLIFSIICILTMLAFPIFSMILKIGNLYVNIAVLIVSLIYGVLWLAFGSNKTYKINRVYKWIRILLTGVSLGINAYTLYLTSKNLNVMSLIIAIAMGISLVFNIFFNILYDVVSYKINKAVKSAKAEAIALKDKIKTNANDLKTKIKSDAKHATEEIMADKNVNLIAQKLNANPKLSKIGQAIKNKANKFFNNSDNTPKLEDKTNNIIDVDVEIIDDDNQ